MTKRSTAASSSTSCVPPPHQQEQKEQKNHEDEQQEQQQQEEDRRPLCRYFFLNGKCRYDAKCFYSHSLPQGVATREEALGYIPCPYYNMGNCRYGDYCKLKHAPPATAAAATAAPTTPTAAAPPAAIKTTTTTWLNTISTDAPQGPSSSVAAAAVSQTCAAEVAEAIVCGICLEDVTETGHKYGLLSCCEHVFCYECLLEWRKEGSQEAQDRHTCPTCRKSTKWVIPSVIRATSPEHKNRIYEQYKARLATIPCKYFKRGTLGSCPYGRDCFYAHLNRQGKDCKQNDKTMQQLYQARRRSRNGQQRDMHILMSRMLLDMFEFRELGYDFYFDSDDGSDDFGEFLHNGFDNDYEDDDDDDDMW